MFNFKNTSYFVFPGFLLVSFTGTPISLFIKELLPTLLLPKNRKELQGGLLLTKLKMLEESQMPAILSKESFFLD